MKNIVSRLLVCALLAIGLSLQGCSSAYYNTMEKFGVHKRDILVDRVKEARDSQKSGEKQFASALEQFKSVVAVDGGNLEKAHVNNGSLRRLPCRVINDLQTTKTRPWPGFCPATVPLKRTQAFWTYVANNHDTHLLDFLLFRLSLRGAGRKAGV